MTSRSRGTWADIPRAPIPDLDGLRNALQVVAYNRPEARSVDLESFVDRTLLQVVERGGFVEKLYGGPPALR